jgi:phospholipid-binding lipoprotein MlaA
VRRILIFIFLFIAIVGMPLTDVKSVCAQEISEQENILKAAGAHTGWEETKTPSDPSSESEKAVETKEREKTAGGIPEKTQTKEDISEEGDEDFDEEDFDEEIETIADPIKPFNLLMFEFNDKFYFYFLKPIAHAYRAILPEPLRVSLRNVISNITTPVRLINCLLQGKFEAAAIEYSRFMVNTTAGLGFFDIAKKYHNLEKQDEDFGQTLGFYGVKEGLYIVWPFFGPSTARDTLGMVGDFFADPLIYVNPTRDLGVVMINSDIRTGINATKTVNETSLTLGTYEEFKESSIDPYISMRNAYFEHRKSKIKK